MVSLFWDFFSPIYETIYTSDRSKSPSVEGNNISLKLNSTEHLFFSDKQFSDTIIGTISNDKTPIRLYGRAGLLSEALNLLIDKANLENFSFAQIKTQNNDVFDLLNLFEKIKRGKTERHFIVSDEFVAREYYDFKRILKIKKEYPRQLETISELERMLLRRSKNSYNSQAGGESKTEELVIKRNEKDHNESLKSIDDDNPLAGSNQIENLINDLRVYLYQKIKVSLRNYGFLDQALYINELKRAYYASHFDRETIGVQSFQKSEKNEIYWMLIKLMNSILKEKNIKLFILAAPSNVIHHKLFHAEQSAENKIIEEKYFSIGIPYMSFHDQIILNPQDLDLNPYTLLRRGDRYNLVGKLKIAHQLLLNLSSQIYELKNYKSEILYGILGKEINVDQTEFKILPWVEYIEQRKMDYYYKWFLNLSSERHASFAKRNLDYLTYFYKEVMPFIENEKFNKNYDIEEGGLDY